MHSEAPFARASLASPRARAGLGLALCLALSVGAGASVFEQPGFSETVVFSGLTFPTVVRFLPDGRVLVAEKSGLIKVFPNIATNTFTVVADLSSEVHDFWDRGLLGMAVDPNFAANNFIYVLYSYNAPIGGSPPAWPGTSCPDPPGATTDGCVISGRLSRLTAVGTDWTASETPLINDWCQQFPSHSIGSLNFGADGYLYATAGDGGNFDNTDWGQWGGTDGMPPVTPKNPCGDPPGGVGGTETPPSAEGGALRAQSHNRAAAEPRVLNGALLRIDPATGLAAPGNPFEGSSSVNEQRIVAYGLRNPFRFTIKPGTNDVWISDVGWNNWEEVDRVPDVTVARNFGWPCYEGVGHEPEYDAANLTLCETLYAQVPQTVTPPVFTYNHGSHAAPGDGCPVGSSSVAGITFYMGTSNYPANYDNALFFSDYSRACVWVMFPGGNGDPDPTTVTGFTNSTGGPVNLEIGPDGNVYYVDYDNGKITRFVYGLNAIAVATSPTGGPLPLTVTFDGTGSQPAQAGDTLSYAWDLDGDGQFDDSTSSTPSFQYTVAGAYSVRLKVTDQRGASSVSAPIVIHAGNQPPVPTITAPLPTLTYKVGDVVAFSGSATDAEDGTLPPSALSWVIIIHHCPSNCHTHTYQTFTGVASGTFLAPDHEYPSYLEIQLTATDSGGVPATTSVFIQPQTVTLQFQSAPSGLQLTVGTFAGVTPFAHTVVVNSANGVNAPSPQGTYPVIWQYASWSDGGAQTHTVTAGAAPATYTATYASYADLSLGMSASPPAVCEGDPMTYTLDVANAGLSQATSVSVSDTLPAGAALVSAGGAGWTCGSTAPVICTLPALDIGAAAPITIVLTAPAGTAVNAATVGSAVTDANGGDNTASAPVTVNPSPGLPSIAAANWAPAGATGIAASVADDAGSTYAWTLGGGTLVSGQGTHAVTFDAGTPGTTMALGVIETNSSSCASPAAALNVQVDFLDVAPSNLFHDFVDAVARNGVTAGCGGGNYCPAAPNTRAQMAVFLLKSKYGAGHVPPPATGLFGDVPVSDPFAPWIEELATLGVTTGCHTNPLLYCPASPVTRAQMAVFLLKTLLGAAYRPPTAVGIFADVPPGAFAADWIEDLYGRSITGGCQASPRLYCPASPNTRGQMAVFLTKTFSLQ